MVLIKIRSKPLFGNSVSFSNKRSKRKFNINYKEARLWSFILRRFVKLKCSVSFLKTIKKYGGVDFYVINFKRLPRQLIKLKVSLLSLILNNES
ncbi:50S ribosomal protein L28 [Candidatus Hodgkinia cicadicola]|nr:50S ribosomal protein L28 [Candidatus Hodgkinia cicadicola]